MRHLGDQVCFVELCRLLCLAPALPLPLAETFALFLSRAGLLVFFLVRVVDHPRKAEVILEQLQNGMEKPSDGYSILMLLQPAVVKDTVESSVQRGGGAIAPTRI